MEARAPGRSPDVNRFPLVLAHSQIRRMLERRPSALVSTTRPRLGGYVVQDALTVRRNERFRRANRSDQQLSPDICAISITAVDWLTLGGLDYPTIHACGFRTQRDFYDDWLRRRQSIDVCQDVCVARFHFIEQPRFLHYKTFGGYTTDPALSMPGEPEALSADDLQRLSAGSRARYEREHRDRLHLERARSISLRVREATRAGRPEELLALRAELERLADAMLTV